jgi:hypothetical protein
VSTKDRNAIEGNIKERTLADATWRTTAEGDDDAR